MKGLGRYHHKVQRFDKYKGTFSKLVLILAPSICKSWRPYFNFKTNFSLRKRKGKLRDEVTTIFSSPTGPTLYCLNLPFPHFKSVNYSKTSQIVANFSFFLVPSIWVFVLLFSFCAFFRVGDFKKNVEIKAPNQTCSRVSLSDFLNQKLHKSSVLPTSVQVLFKQFFKSIYAVIRK